MSKSELKVRMVFTARVEMGDEVLATAEQMMGFPTKLDREDNEQVVISLGEGQELAGKIAAQCGNVAVWRAAYNLRREEAEKAEAERVKFEEESLALELAEKEDSVQ